MCFTVGFADRMDVVRVDVDPGRGSGAFGLSFDKILGGRSVDLR
jgi:hypothetical protein